MKNRVVFFYLALLSLFYFISCSKHDGFPEYSGLYLGQKPPGNNPQLFMPGLISPITSITVSHFLNRDGYVCFRSWKKGLIIPTKKMVGQIREEITRKLKNLENRMKAASTTPKRSLVL